MAVSRRVGAGDQSQVLCRNNKQLLTTIHSPAPPPLKSKILKAHCSQGKASILNKCQQEILLVLSALFIYQYTFAIDLCFNDGGLSGPYMCPVAHSSPMAAPSACSSHFCEQFSLHPQSLLTNELLRIVLCKSIIHLIISQKKFHEGPLFNIMFGCFGII